MTTKRRALTPDAVRQLTMGTDPWLSCDDCFDLLDQCIEALVDRHAVPGRDLRVHLAGCAACDEEARSLLVLLAEDQGVDADRLVPLLESTQP
jgi:hypothetical protein